MSNLVQLPLEFQIGGFKTHLNPVAIKGLNGLLLVDCGNPGFLPKLEEAMAVEGLSPGDVRKILITHQDPDHIGALKALLDKYPGIEVLCSLEQAPGITGTAKPFRLARLEQLYESMTDGDEKRALAEEIGGMRKVPAIDSVTTVSDGGVLPDFNVKVIEVAGHMPGHLCVYVEREKTLIAGDALISSDGKLLPPDPRFALDLPAAIKSLEKLLDYDILTVICYHGGLVTEHVRESLLSIVRGE
jgi:glyoxylase-like metal-dependent hydrolase (beta-lactamase superfamily II)